MSQAEQSFARILAGMAADSGTTLRTTFPFVIG
jgi:hypothetical protein